VNILAFEMDALHRGERPPIPEEMVCTQLRELSAKKESGARVRFVGGESTMKGSVTLSITFLIFLVGPVLCAENEINFIFAGMLSSSSSGSGGSGDSHECHSAARLAELFQVYQVGPIYFLHYLPLVLLDELLCHNIELATIDGPRRAHLF